VRIWPVILDSQPGYLRGRGRSRSLLLAPIGPGTLIEHLLDSLAPVAGNPPVVVSAAGAPSEYRRWVHDLCPTAHVVDGPQEITDVFAICELSDAFLVIDPRRLALDSSELPALMRKYAAEPQVAHYLVAFEPIAGTTERVSFDTDGHVRGIHRHYEQATWPFISGVMAAVVPVACGALRNGAVPKSLAEMRKTLTASDVPGRDVAVEGAALDLSDEHGMLAANEIFTLKAAAARQKEGGNAGPLLIGDGHSIHPDARLVGPIVIHPGARIDEHVTILGPAVIGAGARIASGAVVAHATIGADCIVPPGRVVRDQVWFDAGDGAASCPSDRPAPSFDERLARLSIEAPESRQLPHHEVPNLRRHLYAKRAMDAAAAALSLAILSPLLLLIGVVVWLESKGPILYGDKREGLGGRVFRCWKFRTMYTGAHLAQRDLNTLDQTDGPHFKVDRDPRVTYAGRVLRTLNFDELPQFINVLLGEMSLVGPRPSPFRENQVCVPWREARLSVRPGITGLWQVCRHDRSDGDFHQWIEYDLLYVQHLSFWLDLRVLAATLLTLGGKASHVPASWLVRPAPADTAPLRAPREAKEVVAA
jgi:lipopolysaccharide/colanic/teichoic acid biosynthesis glycosyltransferase